MLVILLRKGKRIFLLMSNFQFFPEQYILIENINFSIKQKIIMGEGSQKSYDFYLSQSICLHIWFPSILSKFLINNSLI